jgi:hypothetical protein
VDSEEKRARILARLRYLKGRKGRGLTLVNGLPEDALEQGDRLVPSLHLADVAQLATAPLPLDIVFWRATADGRGAVLDRVNNRCPLFSRALGTDPDSCLAIDTLHTVYYGPVMRWTAAAIWRALLANPWGFVGGFDEKISLCVRRLRLDLFEWLERCQIPQDRRIGDLTIAMLGEDKGCSFGGLTPHPGCMLKTKAAETGLLMEWGIQLLKGYTGAAFREELLVAGEALLEWLETIRASPLNVPLESQQRMADCAVRHLAMCERAMVTFVPKCHFFAHLCHRTVLHGNPKMYSTFLDESLNLLLRNLAARAHRRTHAGRVLRMMNLVGELELNEYIFGASV